MPDKIGSLITGIEGIELTVDECEILGHPLIGGVILFARNYHSPDQLKMLCQKIRSSHKDPLLIMADQEGGRVQRFINGFTRIPNMGLFGQIYDDSPHEACRLAKECGWISAVELLAHGIDLSLSPVLDLNKGLNTVIANRAFHSDPKPVVALALSYIEGMHEAGMASIGKHFPGHGAVISDSHDLTPFDDRPMNEIKESDMIPFVKLIESGIKGIMAAHIIFPKIDTHRVGFSRVWLQDILRKQLDFKGSILSDDLNMKGADISARYEDRFIAAREAGCDFILVCNNRKATTEVLDNIFYPLHMLASEKGLALQGKFSLQKEPLEVSRRWRHAHEFLRNLNV